MHSRPIDRLSAWPGCLNLGNNYYWHDLLLTHTLVAGYSPACTAWVSQANYLKTGLLFSLHSLVDRGRGIWGKCLGKFKCGFWDTTTHSWQLLIIVNINHVSVSSEILVASTSKTMSIKHLIGALHIISLSPYPVSMVMVHWRARSMKAKIIIINHEKSISESQLNQIKNRSNQMRKMNTFTYALPESKCYLDQADRSCQCGGYVLILVTCS
jgi:hypothetical protein